MAVRLTDAGASGFLGRRVVAELMRRGLRTVPVLWPETPYPEYRLLALWGSAANLQRVLHGR